MAQERAKEQLLVRQVLADVAQLRVQLAARDGKPTTAAPTIQPARAEAEAGDAAISEVRRALSSLRSDWQRLQSHPTLSNASTLPVGEQQPEGGARSAAGASEVVNAVFAMATMALQVADAAAASAARRPEPEPEPEPEPQLEPEPEPELESDDQYGTWFPFAQLVLAESDGELASADDFLPGTQVRVKDGSTQASPVWAGRRGRVLTTNRREGCVRVDFSEEVSRLLEASLRQQILETSLRQQLLEATAAQSPQLPPDDDLDDSGEWFPIAALGMCGEDADGGDGRQGLTCVSAGPFHAHARVCDDVDSVRLSLCISPDSRLTCARMHVAVRYAVRIHADQAKASRCSAEQS